MPFSNEQLRLHENLTVAYEEWIAAQRTLFGHAGRPSWKTVAGKDYLYLIRDGAGNGTSLGRRSPKTEAIWQEIGAQRKQALSRSKSLANTMAELAAQYRALRLPRIADAAARVLVECDRRGLLGSDLLVVGTNAMAAYELEAMERFATGLDATQDCDLTWAGGEATALSTSRPILDALKAVDSTYTVNTERPFQIRNAQAYEIEVLLPESLAARYPKSETIRPIPMAEQDQLLLGHPISQVVTSQRGIVARLVVPDPRYFALHKHWLSLKPQRNERKRPKDRQQAVALWAAIARSMPRYPLDASFRATVPTELKASLRQLSGP